MAYDLATGRLARDGLLSSEALTQADELLAQLQAARVETLRVLFADQHGILRGKTLVAEAFTGLFRTGLNVPSTLLLKDTSHRTAFPVWDEGRGQDAFVPMRGAGDVIGTAQSGLPRFQIADLERQADLMAIAQSDARALMTGDPELTGARGRAARTLLWLLRQDEAIRLISVG